LPWFRETGFAAGYWGFSFGVAAIMQSSLRMTQMGVTGPVAELAPWLSRAAPAPATRAFERKMGHEL